jgi:hypothetical protein
MVADKDEYRFIGNLAYVAIDYHSGCTTLLKTLAGEMDGIYVDKGSSQNYEGDRIPLMFYPYAPLSLRQNR